MRAMGISETVALSFFNSRASFVTKLRMVEDLKSSDSFFGVCKRVMIQSKDVLKCVENEIGDFVSVSTVKFFERFEISSYFFSKEPVDWEVLEDSPSTSAEMEKIAKL